MEVWRQMGMKEEVATHLDAAKLELDGGHKGPLCGLASKGGQREA
jgi:hypothetical protein